MIDPIREAYLRRALMNVRNRSFTESEGDAVMEITTLVDKLVNHGDSTLEDLSAQMNIDTTGMSLEDKAIAVLSWRG